LRLTAEGCSLREKIQAPHCPLPLLAKRGEGEE
jgi:hypothetical protein